MTSSEGDISVDVSNTDDDPTVSFTTDVQSEAEDVGTMTITAQLSVDATSDVTVPYTLSGTATDVDDYSIDPNPLIITAGDLTDDLTITVVDDALDEDDEDVNLEEFADEIESWVIDEFKRIGLDTAKSVLALSVEDLGRRTDLEEETISEVLNIIKQEFE